jgi:hypothetical protein
VEGLFCFNFRRFLLSREVQISSAQSRAFFASRRNPLPRLCVRRFKRVSKVDDFSLLAYNHFRLTASRFPFAPRGAQTAAILELDRPFGRIIQISGEPLRAALEQLGR